MTEQAVELIKRFEGFRPMWYRCPAGVRTIGYGTTERIPGFSAADVDPPISRDTADRWLRYALNNHFLPNVRDLAGRPDLTANQYGALVSLAYNIGLGALADSTLLDAVRKRDDEQVAREFGRWVYADGSVLEGLVKRRRAEAALYAADLTPERRLPESMIADATPVPIRAVEPLPMDELTPPNPYAHG